MKKFLFIFVLVVSLVLPGAGSVYAAEVSQIDNLNSWLVSNGYPELDFEETDDNVNYYYYMIRNTVNYDYTYIYTFSMDSSISFSAYYKPYDFIYLYVDENLTYEKITRNLYHLDDSSYVLAASGNGTLNCVSGYEVIYSNFDIYTDTTFDQFFFQQTPVAQVLGLPEVTLTQILTQENPLKEILILLPMAIPCLVGYVALRKALATLVTLLRTA